MSLMQANIDELFNGPAPPAAPTAIESPSTSTPSAPTTHQPGGRNQSGSVQADTRRILDLVVPVTAVLAERDMTVEAILDIAAGTIIEFDVVFDSDLTLRVADWPIGIGQAVKVGENFGLRVTRIGTVRDRIDALGGQ